MKKNDSSKNFHLSITSQSILTFFSIIGLLYLLFLIKNVLVLIFLGLILALALEPSVEWFVRKRIPYGLSVMIVILLSLSTFGLLGSIAFTPLIQQIRLLTVNFPYYVDSVLNLPGYDSYIDTILAQLSSGGQRIFDFTLSIFSSVLSLLLIVVFTIYILLDFKNIRQYVIGFFPPDRRAGVQKTLTDIEFKLKDWLRGQILLMVVVGALSYLGLTILGLGEFALALGVFAGLLEIIPIIGPTISLIPAAIIGFSYSPAIGLGVIGLYILIQQLENHIIVPKIMERAIGFNPLLTIIAFMVGAELFGIVGGILSLPLLIIISEIFRYLYGYDFTDMASTPESRQKSKVETKSKE